MSVVDNVAVKIKRGMGKFLTHWYAIFIILIITYLCSRLLSDYRDMPKIMVYELFGTALVLIGVLITSLGVVLNREDKKKFLEMKKSKIPDIECVIDSLMIASDFAQIGVVLILIGTIILFAKSFL